MDKVWKIFSWNFRGGICFWICWVGVKDVDEKISMFYADHDWYQGTYVIRDQKTATNVLDLSAGSP